MRPPILTLFIKGQSPGLHGGQHGREVCDYLTVVSAIFLPLVSSLEQGTWSRVLQVKAARLQVNQQPTSSLPATGELGLQNGRGQLPGFLTLEHQSWLASAQMWNEQQLHGAKCHVSVD